MKIEKVSRIESKADKYAVLFDTGDEIKTGITQIADFGLYSGRELSDSEYEQLVAELESRTSKTRAIRILGNRNLSAAEIEKKLREKGESAETAKSTVAWLEESGLVNDEEYANKIVKHYSGRGYGTARIRDELHKRGIPRDLWDTALETLDDDMEERACELLTRKLDGSTDKNEIRKAMSMLHRRGFSYDEARTAMNKYVEQIEETEG